MFCPDCGAFIPEGAGFCRACGAIVRGPSSYTTPATSAPLRPPHSDSLYESQGGPPSSPATYSAYAGHMRGRQPVARWAPPPTKSRSRIVRPTGNDLFTAIFTAGVLVSLYLPFYQLRLSDPFETVKFKTYSAMSDVSGDWKWGALGLSIAILAYLFIRLLFTGQRWPLPIPHAPLLGVLVAANLAMVVVGFFNLPAGGFQISVAGVALGVTHDWGAFVALSMAIFALGASLFNRTSTVR